MKEPNDLPLFSYEGKILQNILSILRNDEMNSREFLKILLYIEKQISQVLLKDGSFCKFLFEVKNLIFFFYFN